jgi:uncharacterized membrane protein YfhO
MAVIDKRFQNLITKSSYPSAGGDTIMLKSYKPNELVYESKSSDEKLAVFSEIYYPAGWKSFIDGRETPYFRADYVLRAIIVPAGNHEIKFTFEPASYFTGNKISYASSAIFILLVAGFFVTKMRKKKSE